MRHPFAPGLRWLRKKEMRLIKRAGSDSNRVSLGLGKSQKTLPDRWRMHKTIALRFTAESKPLDEIHQILTELSILLLTQETKSWHLRTSFRKDAHGN
jgi:hypothetical protein